MKNAWSELLEALHSALIDEINRRLPKIKPILQLPKRSDHFLLPAPEAIVVPVFFKFEKAKPTEGVAALCFEKALLTDKLNVNDLWSSTLKRAQDGFERKGIAPEFGKGGLLLPKKLKIHNVIWIPLELPNGHCFLGVGI